MTAGRSGAAADTIVRFLESAAADASGMRATLAVAIAAAAVAVIGWIPLGWPVQTLGAAVPQPTCFGSGPLTWACSALAAVATLAAPVALLALIFVARRRIAEVIRANVERLPVVARFLVGPSVATALFVLTWASAHHDVMQWGLVPQILFPALVGLFGWITVRWNLAIQQKLAAFFARRDALSRRRRFAVAAAVPAALGIVLGIDPEGFAWKEQFVVLAGLASVYLALVPRTGDLIEAIEEAVTR
jgi:hypothetical protein